MAEREPKKIVLRGGRLRIRRCTGPEKDSLYL